VTVRRELTCEDFRDLAAAYALGVLDESERIACAHHLAEGAPHRGCVAAVEEARWTTARLSAAVPAEPLPPGLWPTIAGRVTSVPHSADRRRKLRKDHGRIPDRVPHLPR
jgi:hypothetical protein